MITVRDPETIYQAHGQIRNGTFHGRWHFSFDRYYDPEYMHFGTLRIVSDAAVYSCFLEKGRKAEHRLEAGRGAYFYVLEGGPVEVNGVRIPELGAAKIEEEAGLRFEAENDTLPNRLHLLYRHTPLTHKSI